MRELPFLRVQKELFESLPEEYSHLYLAIEGQLAAVICIEDPLRVGRRRQLSIPCAHRYQEDRHDDG